VMMWSRLWDTFLLQLSQNGGDVVVLNVAALNAERACDVAVFHALLVDGLSLQTLFALDAIGVVVELDNDQSERENPAGKASRSHHRVRPEVLRRDP
jgi:hypothetical protein